MLTAIGYVAAVVFNILIYFILGSMITGRLKERRFSGTLSVITGFFLYYILFDIVCIPITLLYRPLHLLAYIWAGILIALIIISFILNFKKWRVFFTETAAFVKEHLPFVVFLGAFILIVSVVIIYCYQFTLDAAYYVGTASTSLFTDSIKIYDPYTGMWQDHFEMRYVFNNYAVNDAVMCYLTGLHPLIWTKTVMEAVVIILSFTVLYRLGRALFKEDLLKTGIFIFFSMFLCFFYSTIYTSSEFFITRTYEGKTILGSVVLPLILLVYIKLLEDHRDSFCWLLLLLVSLGSIVLSNSSGMLFPAALFVFMLPLFLIKRDPLILVKSAAVSLPCLISVVIYILYVKGYFVLYTMPR